MYQLYLEQIYLTFDVATPAAGNEYVDLGLSWYECSINIKLCSPVC